MSHHNGDKSKRSIRLNGKVVKEHLFPCIVLCNLKANRIVVAASPEKYLYKSISEAANASE